MQSHTAGTAWILRVFFSGWLLAALCLPIGPVSAFPEADDLPPSLLDLTAPVVLPEGAANGAASWADYDSDGDLDLLATGIGRAAQPTTLMWKNTGGVLERVTTSLPNVESAAAAWGDYDNDNDLDLLIMGQISFTGGRINGLTRIYRNDSGKLTHLTSAVLPPLYRGWGDWGDYDNDGDLDLLLTGYVTGGGPLTAIYRNNGAGIFTDSGIVLPGAGYSNAAWGDFDNDYDLDLVVIGLTVTGPIARVYRQNYSASSGYQFSLAVDLPGMWNGTTNWIDVDSDGWMELLLTGNMSAGPGGASAPVTRLIRYSSGAFQEVDTALPDIWNSSTAWGDYDNDGDLDLALNGLTTTEQVTGIYRNDGGSSFTLALNLPRGYGLSMAWGNFDGDPNRALDLATSGQDSTGAYTTRIYRGVNVTANLPPSTPDQDSACWDPSTDRLLFDWSSALDDHTTNKGITYAMRVGTTPGGSQMIAPAANVTNGYRRGTYPGQVFTGTNAMLRGLPFGRYYWSVQAVDSAYSAGLFSSEGVVDYGVEIGVDDIALTTEGTDIRIPVLENDNKSRGTLSIEFIQDPVHGTAVTEPGNPHRIQYTPDPNFFGVDRFYYHPTDPTNYCSRAYVEVTVLPLNPDYPTDIVLTSSSVNENQPVNTQVGRLTTEDPDNPYDEHTYSLVSGIGSEDNNLFQIKKDWLITKEIFDYETYSTYHIRVQSTDLFGLSVEKALTIQINDTMESVPVIILEGTKADTATVTMSEDGINAADEPDPFVLTLNASDEDPGDTLFWSILTPALHGTAQIDPAPVVPGQAITVYYTPEADSIAPDSFVVQVTDEGGLFDTITVDVTINPVNDPPRLDPLYDVTYSEWSGPHYIPLIGLIPGPPDETESMTYQVETDKPWLISSLEVVETSPGAVEICFKVRAGAAPATITLTIDDGQPDHYLTQRTFFVYTLPAGTHQYLPVLHKSP